MRRRKESNQNQFVQGTFELHKGHSNVKELETACSVPAAEEETYAKKQFGIPRKEGATLLSLQWDKGNDTISVNFPSESTEPTKCGILSKVAKIYIYDPLGLVSPITLGGKFLYRDICDAKLAKQLNVKLGSMGGETSKPSYCAKIISNPSRGHSEYRVTCLQ